MGVLCQVIWGNFTDGLFICYAMYPQSFRDNVMWHIIYCYNSCPIYWWIVLVLLGILQEHFLGIDLWRFIEGNWNFFFLTLSFYEKGKSYLICAIFLMLFNFISSSLKLRGWVSYGMICVLSSFEVNWFFWQKIIWFLIDITKLLALWIIWWAVILDLD